MISRRGLMRRAGLAAAVAGGAALPAGTARAASPGLADLAAMPAEAGPVHIPGQGWFEAVPAAGEADGIVRIEAQAGHQWLRSGAEGVLRPAWFTDPADGADAAPAIQRALDHAARFGPLAVDLGSGLHACRTALSMDPTRVVLRGTGAVLDFAGMAEPEAAPPILTLDGVAPEGGWRRDADALACDEGGGARLALDLPLPGPGRTRVSLTVGALDGHTDYPALTVAVIGGDRATLGEITVISPGRFDFEVDGPDAGARLTIETDAAVRIDALDAAHQGRRECLLVATGPAGTQYGHKWIEGVEIAGPGGDTALHGIRFETRTDAMSSRLDLREVTVRGFHTGLVFSHRAYLIRAQGLRVACGTGLHFLGGLADAGELISFHGCVIDGGRVAVRNNDAEVVMTATAIDFVDKVFVGSGRLDLIGCHLEVKRPRAPDAPLFDLGQGRIALAGGSFGVTGMDFDAGNQCDHIFELRSRAATASMREVSVYNLRSRSGALAGGPGRLDTALIRGRRPRHMAPIVQFDQGRNLLGSLPIDVRTSDTPTGGFARYPRPEPGFKVSPAFRHVWVFGRAHPGAEAGLWLRVRADAPGTIIAVLQAFRGEDRVDVGDAWPIEVTPDWQPYANNTAGTHPASGRDGRMPEGYGEVALRLDLTGVAGTVEIADVFLCAV